VWLGGRKGVGSEWHLRLASLYVVGLTSAVRLGGRTTRTKDNKGWEWKRAERRRTLSVLSVRP
jgi:hypothetical protein